MGDCADIPGDYDDVLGGGDLKRGEIAKGYAVTLVAMAVYQDSKAEAYVVGQGKKDGCEHLCAYDLDAGKSIDFTKGDQISVRLTDKMKLAAKDPNRNIVLHHNHTNKSSLSATDLNLFVKYGGICKVVAYADGFTYSATPVQRGNISGAVKIARSEAANWARNLQLQCCAARSDAEAEWLVSHVMCRLLDAAGVISYQFPMEAERRNGYILGEFGVEVFIASASIVVKAGVRARTP